MHEVQENVRRGKLGHVQPASPLTRLLVTQMFLVFLSKKIARSTACISKIVYVKALVSRDTTLFQSPVGIILKQLAGKPWPVGHKLPRYALDTHQLRLFSTIKLSVASLPAF